MHRRCNPGEGDSPRTELVESPPHPPRVPRVGLSPQAGRGDRTRDGSGDDFNAGHPFAFSRRHPPEFCFTASPSLKQRAQERPGGRMHPGRPRKMVARKARLPQVQAGSARPSLRSGFTAYGALSSVNLADCHRRRDALTASSAWRQAFGAPGPHAFAVRVMPLVKRAHPRPPQFRTTFRDDA